MHERNNEIFQRVEKKYLIDEKRYEVLRKYLNHNMEVDEYGLSTICNVYYDTEDFLLVRRSNEKPPYKEKLRLRSYGVPKEDGKCYIEIKKKWEGVVYKRRIELMLKEARNYLGHGIYPKSLVNPQILKEIDYFRAFYAPVPKMFIAYDRIAMYGKEDPKFRITFDFGIRARENDLDLAKGDAGEFLLEWGEVLMEVKVNGAYPLWFTELLCKLELYPVSFSKYGRIYNRKLQEEKQRQKQEDRLCLPA